MKWQTDVAHQILVGLEELDTLDAPILAPDPHDTEGELRTASDSWVGEIDYDTYVAHCTWLAEEGLVVPWETGNKIAFLRNNPGGTIPPYGYSSGYTQPQRLTARGHRYLQAVRSKGGLTSVLGDVATKVGLKTVDMGFTQILEHLGV